MDYGCQTKMDLFFFSFRGVRRLSASLANAPREGGRGWVCVMCAGTRGADALRWFYLPSSPSRCFAKTFLPKRIRQTLQTFFLARLRWMQ
jgi:hypothetical protein